MESGVIHEIRLRYLPYIFVVVIKNRIIIFSQPIFYDKLLKLATHHFN